LAKRDSARHGDSANFRRLSLDDAHPLSTLCVQSLACLRRTRTKTQYALSSVSEMNFADIIGYKMEQQNYKEIKIKIYFKLD